MPTPVVLTASASRHAELRQAEKELKELLPYGDRKQAQGLADVFRDCLKAEQVALLLFQSNSQQLLTYAFQSRPSEHVTPELPPDISNRIRASIEWDEVRAGATSDDPEERAEARLLFGVEYCSTILMKVGASLDQPQFVLIAMRSIGEPFSEADEKTARQLVAFTNGLLGGPSVLPSMPRPEPEVTVADGFSTANRPNAAELLSAVETIADKVCKEIGFVGGLVYTAVPRSQALHGIVACGFAKNAKVNYPYVYPLSKEFPSAAATGFESPDGKEWSNPYDHPHEVNQDGLDLFQIKGSLISIPLLSRNERFGSVVLWADRYFTKEEKPSLRELKRLAFEKARPLARQLRSSLFEKTKEQREHLHREVAKIMRQMMTETDLDRNLTAILQSIRLLSFERVRVYQFRYSNCFVGRLTAGMEGTISEEEFRQIRLVAVEGDPQPANYFAKLMYDAVCKARKSKGDGGDLDDLLARVHHPTDEHSGGAECQALGKKAGKGWAEAPVLIGGRLYALIAADNHHSERPIRDDDLEVLDVFAGLAAQAFQLNEKKGVLAHLDELDAAVGPNAPSDLIIRRLLLFSTHGEGGLGFSRALFFEAVLGQPGVFQFRHGVGSLSKDDFFSTAQQTYRLQLKDVLAAARLNDDHGLNAKMNRPEHRFLTTEGVFQAGATDLQAVTKYCKSSVGEPPWASSLRSALGSDEILVAPTWTATGLRGLLVADRCWQKIDLDIDDSLNLRAFARHAGEVLTQREWVRRRDEDVQTLFNGVSHDLTDPIAMIRNALVRLRCSFPRPNSNEIIAVEQALDSWDRAFTAIKECADTEHSVMQTMKVLQVIPEVIQPAIDDLRASFSDARFELVVSSEFRTSAARIEANSASLGTAIRNLLRNSVEALSKATAPDVKPAIVIEADQNGGYVVVVVRDQGTGIPHPLLQQFNRGHVLFSTKKPNRIGYGLYAVRRVADRHSGRFSFDPTVPPGQGTRAVLEIPITR